MGLRYLYGFCFALFSVSSLAADPPVPRGNVSVTRNPTTSYYHVNSNTLNTPHGVTVSPIRDIVPQVSRYPGGIQQTLPTGVTIDAINKGGPLSVAARATTNGLKTAAIRCLTGMKCNLVFMAGSAGLQTLLDGVDWVITEGSQITKLPVDPNYSDPLSGFYKATDQSGDPTGGPNHYPSAKAACAVTAGCVFHGACIPTPHGPIGSFNCTKPNGEPFGSAFLHGPLVCPVGSIQIPAGCFTDGQYVPVSPAEIADTVNNNYNPDPSDWPFLTPELDLNDLEITSAPTLKGDPKTITIRDANGNPISISETNVWFDFDIRDNPSSKPSLDLNKREEEKTYKDGQLTSTTTTTSTDSAPTYVTGAGAGNKEPPTDCDFMPTVCAFIDWFKDDNIPQDSDLSSILNDEDFERSYSINFGSNSCPEPISIQVAYLNKTVELSYEPACDLMGYARPFVLISAYLFAIYIGLGVVRNG